MLFVLYLGWVGGGTWLGSSFWWSVMVMVIADEEWAV